jgi:hypothetical protein
MAAAPSVTIKRDMTGGQVCLAGSQCKILIYNETPSCEKSPAALSNRDLRKCVLGFTKLVRSLDIQFDQEIDLQTRADASDRSARFSYEMRSDSFNANYRGKMLSYLNEVCLRLHLDRPSVKAFSEGDDNKAYAYQVLFADALAGIDPLVKASDYLDSIADRLH